LFLQERHVAVAVELVPVVDALRRRGGQRQLARIFEEPGWLAHLTPPSNPKSEYRNPKQIQNPNTQIQNQGEARLERFGSRICFGFRYSDFGFISPPPGLGRARSPRTPP